MIEEACSENNNQMGWNMNSRFKSVAALMATGLLVLTSLLLTACGGGGGGGTTTPPAAGKVVSGILSKGPVTGGVVKVYQATTTGALGTLVATSNAPTDSYGNWSATIPTGVTGPFVAVSSGGTYKDEVTGTTLAAPAMKTVWDGAAAIAPITPITTAAVDAALSVAAQNNTTIANAFTLVTSSITTTYGFNPVTTPANDPAYVTALTAFSGTSGGTVPGVQTAITSLTQTVINNAGAGAGAGVWDVYSWDQMQWQ